MVKMDIRASLKKASVEITKPRIYVETGERTGRREGDRERVETAVLDMITLTASSSLRRCQMAERVTRVMIYQLKLYGYNHISAGHCTYHLQRAKVCYDVNGRDCNGALISFELSTSRLGRSRIN